MNMCMKECIRAIPLTYVCVRGDIFHSLNLADKLWVSKLKMLWRGQKVLTNLQEIKRMKCCVGVNNCIPYQRNVIGKKISRYKNENIVWGWGLEVY